MTHRRWFVGALILVACGTPLPPAMPVAPVHTPPVSTEVGVEVLVIPQRTQEHIWLSLWSGAGALHADPPALATLTAWAIEAHDDALRATTHASGTEWTLECTAARLESCIQRLAAALTTSEIPPEDFAQLRARLRATQQRAVDQTERRSDTLALQTLLGPALNPLQSNAQDDTLTPENVRRFQERYHRPGNLLLVGAGDIDEDTLRTLTERYFAPLPSVARAAQTAPQWNSGGHVEIANRSQATWAIATGDLNQAHQLAHRLTQRLREEGDVARAEVFPWGANHVVLLRLQPPFDWARIQHLSEWIPALQFALLDAPPTVVLQNTRADVQVQWQAARWLHPQSSLRPHALSLGVLLNGGRGDDLRNDNPDQEMLAQAQRRLDRIMNTYREQLREEPHTTSFEGAIHAVNIQAQVVDDSGRFGLAFRFAGGVREEHENTHGWTTLLSDALVAQCQRTAPAELGRTMDAMGITIRPWVALDEFGFSFRAPGNSAAATLHLALRCLQPNRFDAFLSAQQRAIEAVSHPHAQIRGLTAIHLAPQEPGPLAIRGTAQSLANATPDRLQRFADARLARRRLRIGMAGEFELPTTLVQSRLLLSSWPEGAPYAPGNVQIQADTPHRVQSPSEDLIVTITLVQDAPTRSAIPWQAIGRHLGQRLEALPTITHATGSGLHVGELDILRFELSLDLLDESAIRTVVSRVRETLQRDAQNIANTFQGPSARMQSWRDATFEGHAVRLARPISSTTSVEEIVHTLQQLSEGRAFLVIGYPRP